MPASQNRMKLHRRLLCALLFCPLLVRAAIIGTNVPATPLTAERAASLPAWKIYFENSTRQQQADQDFLRAELKAHGLKQSTLPHKMNSAKGLALDRTADWYGGDEARRIADILRSFQTPAGGWSKNTDFTQRVRAPGEMFGAENGSLHLGMNDFDAPADPSWSYVGTFDNDATTTELRFLAKVISANATNSAAWRAAFSRGLEARSGLHSRRADCGERQTHGLVPAARRGHVAAHLREKLRNAGGDLVRKRDDGFVSDATAGSRFKCRRGGPRRVCMV